MPPKAKITREMVVEAAFDVARENGAEEISARSVAERLGCSTQPVMYHFKTIEELKRAAYAKADAFHTEYITGFQAEPGDIMKGIGLRYIRFAAREKNLFRFLFQSNLAEGSIAGMIDSEDAAPITGMMSMAMGLDAERTKKVFLAVAMFAHGYASMLANNTLEYNEDEIMRHMEFAYNGAVLAVKEENNEKTV
ncbi:MAG: TetR/AcrR family transcriptional regulator [Lachnospiraceae bacterium]|nr:TetR/AcrR family transcriptional regulator [Ruminococcus sp.]MCM1274466.1 TetR/AcrR family transcriptional regulator [Lachnospiraceae bacterium]